MSDAARLTRPWLDFQQPAVRDLVWLIASPPLLPDSAVSDLPANPALWPDADDYLALYRRHERWLRRLDAQPAPLLQYLARSRSARLGHYAEDLLRFWLAAPDNLEFELVISQVPLRVSGITLGEPDFLVRERDSGMLWHIELALKFYLGVGNRQWIGPNRHDSLARKLDHLCQRQLPLLQTPAGRAWLQTHGLESARTWAWLKGRLFLPADRSANAGVPNDGEACWFTPGELMAFAGRHDLSWYRLAKPHWLAPGRSTPSDHLPFDVNTDSWLMPTTGTQALVAFRNRHDMLRAFVVGEAWSQPPFD